MTTGADRLPQHRGYCGRKRSATANDLNPLFSLTAWAEINPSSAEGIFEDFGVAKVTEAILATKDPVAILTAGLAMLLELFDDRQAIGNALGGIGLTGKFEEGGG